MKRTWGWPQYKILKKLERPGWFDNTRNGGEDLNLEIHGLNIEHLRVCLQKPMNVSANDVMP